MNLGETPRGKMALYPCGPPPRLRPALRPEEQEIPCRARYMPRQQGPLSSGLSTAPLDLLRLPPLAFASHSRALACSSSSCQVGLLPSCPIRTKWSRPYFALRANPPLRDRSVRRRCRSTSSTRILPSLLLGYHILRRARERCARVGILLGYAVPRAPPSTNVPRGRNLDFVVKSTGPSPFDG